MLIFISYVNSYFVNILMYLLRLRDKSKIDNKKHLKTSTIVIICKIKCFIALIHASQLSHEAAC